MEMLTKIADEIFPFLKECFELDIQSLDFFNKVYSWTLKSYAKIADEIFPFLKECFELDIQSLDFLNKVYLWTLKSYDGTYCHLSLQDIIDYDEYMYKTGNKQYNLK